METWDCNKKQWIPIPYKQKKFLDEIEAVCRNHGLVIAHEDSHGAFQIKKLTEDGIIWLRHAHLKF